MPLAQNNPHAKLTHVGGDGVHSEPLHLLLTCLPAFALISLTFVHSPCNSQSDLLKTQVRTSLAVQWLRLCTSTTGGEGSIPGWETKIPHAGTSLVVQWQRLHAPNAGGPGSIPGQGARSHMPQVRVCMLQLKILHAATKNPACRN